MPRFDLLRRRAARPCTAWRFRSQINKKQETEEISAMFPIRSGFAAILSAVVCAAALPAAAQTVEAFYKSHELTILIGHPPGGSYDLYAQLAAAHIGKYIPGKPTVIVQGMPGGAGSKAAAYLYAKGPKDG